MATVSTDFLTRPSPEPDGHPLFQFHFPGPPVHAGDNIAVQGFPVLRLAAAMDPVGDLGALGKLALAKGLGKGVQDPQSHGVGNHAEIVFRVRGQKPLDILGGHML